MRDTLELLVATWMLAALAITCSACGAQMLGGYQFHDARHDHPYVLDLGTRLAPIRTSGAYLGSDAVFTLPPFADARFKLRHVALSGGYRWHAYPFAIELGSQLGAGQPAFDRWTETGMYLGASLNLLLRLKGDHDSLVGYAPAGLLIDAIIAATAGVWSRVPERNGASTNTGDGMIALGVRFSFVSDIAVSSNQGWVPP
jgi:hypothetical protein